MSGPTTPLMRQYSAIKQQHPNALLLFRLGDFYELFYEDAVVAARELQITLTSRNKERGTPVPMCGVPYHAVQSYIHRLIQKGHRVAICEQMEDPRFAKKLVKREVTRVVTPGTAVDTVQAAEPSYLAAIRPLADRIGLACADLSTGEFRATEFEGPDRQAACAEEMAHLRPREVLWPASAPWQPARAEAADGGTGARFTRTELDEWAFAPEHAWRLLSDHFGVLTLDGFGLTGREAAVSAAGAVLHYLCETQRAGLEHLDGLSFYQQQQWMILDSVTARNLELVEPLFRGQTEATLLAVLDRTLTHMGARLLRSWLLRPSLNGAEIEARLDAVEELKRKTIPRGELERMLSGVLDLERLLSRTTLGTATPRDLLGLGASLERLPSLRAILGRFRSARLGELRENADELQDVASLLERAISPEAPANPADGGVIRAGYHAELDELCDLSRNSKSRIAQIESRERDRTGISSLKARFNNIFGYYLQVSRSNLHLVPADYERKQTLVNAERFTTPELKEYERRVLEAEEKILELERALFADVRAQVTAQAARIRRTAAALAEADVLRNFAALAAESQYTRPQFSSSADGGGEIQVVGGRHPVIERLAERERAERFVPNDLYLNDSSDLILIVTGPNMGGKSTYLRQAALISILAQMGSFVPAQDARLPLLDRIFTRIGASDNLARGRSTFLMEMTETAAILNMATPRSLILLDEIGRGTATFDGLAIAWAVVEHIHSRTRAKTLFATHYHELTALADHLPGVRNYRVLVKETEGGIVFLRKVEPGSADRSYGIEVAKLAGLPPGVVERARQVLVLHERSEEHVSETLSPGAQAAPRAVDHFHSTQPGHRPGHWQRGFGQLASDRGADAAGAPQAADQMMETETAAGRLLLVGFQQNTFDEELARLLAEVQPAGVIFFGRNIAGPAEFVALVQRIVEALADSGPPSGSPLLAMDLEGGPPDQLRDVLAPFPSARAVAATSDDPFVRDFGALVGEALDAFGLNVDLAPVLDLASPQAEPVLGARAVSADPQQVVRFARNFLVGLNRFGVLGCGKHFPGLGGASGDTHSEMPYVEKPADRLREEDLRPFQELHSELPLVMVNHAWYPSLEAPGVDPRPASLSSELLKGLLRERLGFRGVVMSDDLGMGGVLAGRSVEEAAVAAVEAGCDLLLICGSAENIRGAHRALIERAGQDAAFATRIQEAAGRVEALQRALQKTAAARQAQQTRTDWRRLTEAIRRLHERAEHMGTLAATMPRYTTAAVRPQRGPRPRTGAARAPQRGDTRRGRGGPGGRGPGPRGGPHVPRGPRGQPPRPRRPPREP